MGTESRIFADCALDPYVTDSRVDFQALIERLILFDKYILASRRLTEFKHIAIAFGYGPTMELLRSELLEIYCDAVVIGSSAYAKIGDNPQPQKLPLGSYYLPLIRIHNQNDLISGGMAKLAEIPGLKSKQFIKFKGAIADRLIYRKENMGRDSLQQLVTDLKRNDDLVLKSLATLVSKSTGTNIRSEELTLKLEMVPQEVFRTESNLVSHFGLSLETAHKIIENALLAAGSLNMTIEYMKTFSATGTLREDELPFLDARLKFLISHLDASAQIDRFRRIVTLTDVPDIGAACAAGEIKLEKVVEIAQSDECKRFREWLRSTDRMTDAEIRDAFGGIRSKLSGLVTRPGGKLVRWAISTAAGLIPGAGVALGASAGLFDSFLLEKVLPKPGPISFLESHYPSIFDTQK